MASTFKSSVPEVAGVSGAQGQAIVSAPVVDTAGAVAGAISGALKVGERVAIAKAKQTGKNIAHETVDALDKGIASQQQIAGLQEMQRSPVDAETISAIEAEAAGKLDTETFASLKAGLVNGKISQDRVNFLAANEIKKRVAAQPLYADEVRAAAASIIGFDPQSYQTRTLLDRLGEDPTAAGGLTALEKALEEDKVTSYYTGIPLTEIRRQRGITMRLKAEADDAKNRNVLGEENQREISDKAFKFIANNASNKLLLGISELNAGEEPPLQQDYDRFLSQSLAEDIQLFTTESGLDTSSPEYTNGVERIRKHYEVLGDTFKGVGFDSVKKERLALVKDLVDLDSYDKYGNILQLKKVYGESNVQLVLKMLGKSSTDSQFKTFMKNYPELNGLVEGLENPRKGIQELIYTAHNKAARGLPLSAGEKTALRVTAAEASRDPSTTPEARDGIVEALGNADMNVAASSIAMQASPFKASPKTQQLVKANYKEAVPKAINTIASSFAGAMEDSRRNNPTGKVAFLPDLRWNEAEQKFVAASGFNMTEGAASQLDTLNMYATGINNGWSAVLGTTKEDFIREVESRFKEVRLAAEEGNDASSLSEVLDNYFTGNTPAASRRYKEIQDKYPDRLGDVSLEDFAEWNAEAVRRRGKALAYSEIPNISNQRQQAGEGTVLLDKEYLDAKERAVAAGVSADRLDKVINIAIQRKKEAELKKTLETGGIGTNLF